MGAGRFVLGSNKARQADPTLGRVIAQMDGDPEPDDYEETISTSVYVLLDADACQVKIGYTADVDRRKRELESRRGRPLDLLHTFKGGRRLENALHERFRPYRRESLEWYSTEILGEIESMARAA